MDERLKRVIELTAQLKEAVEACDDVLSVHLHNTAIRNDGVHVYRPETLNLGPMEADPECEDGLRWMHAVIDGVLVYGALYESKEEDGCE